MSNSTRDLTLREMIEKSRLETEVKAKTPSTVNRRDFLKGIAVGSLVILCSADGTTTAARANAIANNQTLTPSPVS